MTIIGIVDYWRSAVDIKLSACESGVAVAKAGGQFRKPEEWKRPPFEAYTRGLEKGSETEKILFLL
jgi:hypothetical protein